MLRNFIKHRVQIICIFYLLTITVFGQSINTIRVLLSQQTVERGLAGGEVHQYQITLAADEYLQVRVEQKGVDVVLRLVDADGKLLASMDSPNGNAGSETLSWVAITAGVYELQVSSLDAKAKVGNYRLKRESSRLATAIDRKRVVNERVFVEALAARDKGEQSATAKFEEALRGWRELGETDLVEMTAQQIKLFRGLQAFSEGVKLYKDNTPESWQMAVRKFDEAGKIYHEAGEKAYESFCLDYAGNISNSLGERQKAREFYAAELPLVRAVGDKKVESVLLNKLGLLASFFGEKQKALDYYTNALSLFRELGDKSSEAVILNNFGTIYDDLGDKQKALEFYNQALLITKASGNKNGEATTLGNIGSIYSGLGDKQKALENFNQALTIFRELGNKNYEATTLNNIGAVYDDLGEKQKALDYYNQVLALYKELQDKNSAAITLNNVALVWFYLGEKAKSPRLLQSSLTYS